MERTREEILDDLADADFGDVIRIGLLARELDRHESAVQLRLQEAANQAWCRAFVAGEIC